MMPDKSHNEEYARQIYERNALIQYLNHRYPAVFRVIWEAYLAARQFTMPYGREQAPLDPVTPILQVRRWSRPIPSDSQEDGKKILFFTNTGWSLSVLFDALIGRALTLRGARVSYFTCGGVLPICNIQNASSPVPPMPCGRCRSYVESGFAAFGFSPHELRDLIPVETWKQILKTVDNLPNDGLVAYERDGIPFGYFATVSARWFLLDTVVDDTMEMIQRIREYLLQGLLVYAGVQELLERERPDKIVMINGLFMAEQVMRACATRRGIPYICWERGYLANTVFLVADRPSANYPIHELWEMYRDQPLAESQRSELLDFLHRRVQGYRALDDLWKGIEENTEQSREKLGLGPGRPMAVAFPNVAGDTGVLDLDLAYKDIREWIDHLIACFAAQPDVDLVFRIHPAESRVKRYTPRLSFGDYIHMRHPNLPPNIRVIPSESTVNSYTLVEASDLVLVYTSTLGLEAAVRGKATVVAAQVHYRGKGFTLDIDSPTQMVEMLELWNGGSKRLPQPDIEMAQRYAYTFFFRAMLSLDDVLEEGTFGRMRLKLAGWDDLYVGHIPVIDTLCNGILNGVPFVNPQLEG